MHSRLCTEERGLQRSECFACLRARLEETERERDDYHQKAIDIADQRDGFRDRAEAAERELDFAHETIARLRDDAQAAEAALEKAKEALRQCAFWLRNVAQRTGVGFQCLELVDEILSTPAEPLRTPMTPKQEAGWSKLEAMAARAERLCLGPCAKCDAEQAAEPMRTEGAPKQEECSGHCVCERHMLIINEKEAELRAQVERLEKALKRYKRTREQVDALRLSLLQAQERVGRATEALRFAAKILKPFGWHTLGCNSHPKPGRVSPFDNDPVEIPGGACDCGAIRAVELTNAALAPEAPVEKET